MKNLAFFEAYFCYFIGFGFVFAVLTYFFPFLLSTGIYAILFPFFLCTAIPSTPPNIENISSIKDSFNFLKEYFSGKAKHIYITEF